jgi:hypothetical protein
MRTWTARSEPDATVGDVFAAPANVQLQTTSLPHRARSGFPARSSCIHFEQSHTIWSTEDKRGARLGWNVRRTTRLGGAQIPGRAGVAQGCRRTWRGLDAFDPVKEFLRGRPHTRQGGRGSKKSEARKGCNPPKHADRLRDRIGPAVVGNGDRCQFTIDGGAGVREPGVLRRG